jgi:hypothetical protein
VRVKQDSLGFLRFSLRNIIAPSLHPHIPPPKLRDTPKRALHCHNLVLYVLGTSMKSHVTGNTVRKLNRDICSGRAKGEQVVYLLPLRFLKKYQNGKRGKCTKYDYKIIHFISKIYFYPEYSRSTNKNNIKQLQCTFLSKFDYLSLKNCPRAAIDNSCSYGLMGTWLRHYATRRKIAGSIPNEVTGFFNRSNPPSRNMALGSAQPLTQMSTRNLPGDKGRLARRADNLTTNCESRHSRKCGSLEVPQTDGPLRPVAGIALLFTTTAYRFGTAMFSVAQKLPAWYQFQ